MSHPPPADLAGTRNHSDTSEADIMYGSALITDEHDATLFNLPRFRPLGQCKWQAPNIMIATLHHRFDIAALSRESIRFYTTDVETLRMLQSAIVSHQPKLGTFASYLDEIDLIFPSRCQKAVSSFSLASNSSNDISGASISIALSSMICDHKW